MSNQVDTHLSVLEVSVLQRLWEHQTAAVGVMSHEQPGFSVVPFSLDGMGLPYSNWLRLVSYGLVGGHSGKLQVSALGIKALREAGLINAAQTSTGAVQ